MAQDSYTEVTRQSWGGRLGSSFKGIIVGLIIFVLSFPLLFWNEGRSVETYKSLNEGAAAVVTTGIETVAPNLDGKLVHMAGKADTDDKLSDPEFGVLDRAIKLRRLVLMYQWQENKSSKTEKQLGGGTETVTTYSYEKTWSDQPIDSSNFKKADSHQNPGMPYQSRTVTARNVNLGAYRLSASLIQKINDYSPLRVDNLQVLKNRFQGRAHAIDGGYYIGTSPSQPQVGDIKVGYQVVKPMQVSIVARQIGDSFEPYQAEAGGVVELLQTGTHSAANMFSRAQQENTLLTWVLRMVGFIVMMIGLGMILKPLSVLADVLPLLGNIAEMGIGLVAFLLALVLSLLTIAIAWLFYRPLLSLALLAMAGAAVYLYRRIAKSKTTRQGDPVVQSTG
jgi:hypothetical protein